MKLEDTLETISELKSQIDLLRPIDAETEQRIIQKFRLDWNFHSNNIEGNSLTFGETKTFLLHGITAEGKPLKDHLDIKGHNEAILLIDEIVQGNRPLTEVFIRELHKIILHEPYTRKAKTPEGIQTTKTIEIGKYKTSPNHVETSTGEIFYFATPEETPALMNDLMDWLTKVMAANELPPVAIAAEFHYKFIRIHPFDDGNGRMARILMNFILIKSGYPPVIIKTQEKADYYRALQMADGGDILFFINYIAEQLIHSLNLFLRGAKGESIEDVDDVDKQILLLKARLKEEPSKIIHTFETEQTIVEESIDPLLEAVDLKLKPIKELFNDCPIIIEIQGGTRDMTRNCKNYSSKIASATLAKKSKHESNARVRKTIRIKVTFIFNDFAKTDDKLFSIVELFDIYLDSYFYTVIISEDKALQFRVYYHEKANSKTIPLIANAMAKHVLSEIEKNLAA